MTKRIRPQKTRSAFSGFGSDFTQTLAEVNRLREEVTEARAEVAASSFSATSGAVTVTVTGENRVVVIELTGDIPADAAQLLSDTHAAIASAQEEIANFSAERLAPYTSLADIV